MSDTWGGATALRALVVVLLLAGVLAMHAVGAGHAADPVPGLAGPGAHAMDVGSMDAAQGDTPAAAAGDADGGGGMPHLVTVCIAVLTGGLGLVLLLVLARGIGRTTTPRLPRTSLPAVAAQAPPARPPSLVTLCISRT